SAGRANPLVELRLSGVAEVVVVGLPDPTSGETVAAFVVVRSGHHVSESDVVSACAARITSYKKPSVARFVDDLPRPGLASSSGASSAPTLVGCQRLARGGRARRPYPPLRTSRQRHLERWRRQLVYRGQDLLREQLERLGREFVRHAAVV